VGITVFKKPEIRTSQQLLLFLKYKEVEAKGYETADGFVVLKGSEISPETTTLYAQSEIWREDPLRRVRRS
jgi:hypothetical protein